METLNDWITALQSSGKAIIIEGPKDKAALESFGIQTIFLLSEKPLFAVAEEVAMQFSEVILLTDLDKKGKELYGKLSKEFKRLGVKVDITFREFLQKETKLSHVEGLTTYVRNNP